jgi:tripartite-type tricarboxylate transporter receptor subunit TctC
MRSAGERRAALAAALLLCFPGAAWSQDTASVAYPVRPVRIIVPFTPGAGTDIVGRAVAQALSEAWRQSIVVDNRPGAGGTIAGEIVAKANPDGYTLMLGNVSTLAIARSLYPRLPYDPLKHFAPITLITTSENVVVVHPSVPVGSVRELVAHAKANPRKLNYGSSGSGTTSHLGGAMFASMAGVEMTHVPYKGSGPMLTDLLAGQLQLAFSSVPTALPHIKAGRLKALATTRLKRSATLADLPTVHDTLPGFDISLWQGIVAPAGTPGAVVAKLNREIVRSLHTPELRSRLSAQGLDPVGNSPQEFAAYMKAEADKWARIVRNSGARAE